MSYKKTTGTASLIRHKCKASKTQQSPSKSDALVNLLTPTKPPELTPAPGFKLPAVNISRSSKPDSSSMLETAGRNLAFSQIHLMCHSLMRMDIINEPSYISFLQSLVNYGADFGRQNISNVINSNVICQQMIPEKYETVQLELMNSLNGTEFSISFHKWNSGINDFVTVVGYFFTPDFQFNNQILGTKQCEHDEDVIKVVREITDGYKTVGDVKLKCVCGGPDNDFESFPCMVQQLSKVILDAIDASPDRKEFFKLTEELTKVPIEQSSFQKLKALYKVYQKVNTNEDFHVDPIVKKFTQLVGSLFSAISSLAATSENGSSCVTANKVYLWFKKLLKLYTSMKTEDETAGIILKAIEAIKIPEIYQIAVFLDPNFKNLKFLESSERNKLLDIVRKNLRRMMIDDDSMQPPTKKRKCQSSPSQAQMNLNDSFSEFMDFAMINPVDDQVNSEIQCYTGFKLEDPVDIVHFWRQTECFPYLKKLARNILNLPSCTFHSDCCFLSAGNEFYQNFQNLPAHQIETFTFLHQNL